MTTGKIFKKYENKKVLNFNGDNSFVSIPTNREISSSLRDDHTISILFNAEQQEEKVPIWLVGDLQKRFIEYPLLRKDGSWTWGLSFNNSRAVTMLYHDKINNPIYNWAKRFEHLWTWVTLSYSKEKSAIYFYINDELVCQMNGIKQNQPFPAHGELKSHDSIKPFLIGFCNHTNTFYKGKIAEVKMFNRFFENINEVFEDSNTIMTFNDETTYHNVLTTEEDIEVIENILPFRREGSFYCLPHEDEGFVNGTWKKGATTARNERRFVTEMQQGKIKYKEDGLSQIMDVLEIDNIDETLYPKTKFINVKMTTNNA